MRCWLFSKKKKKKQRQLWVINTSFVFFFLFFYIFKEYVYHKDTSFIGESIAVFAFDLFDSFWPKIFLSYLIFVLSTDHYLQEYLEYPSHIWQIKKHKRETEVGITWFRVKTESSCWLELSVGDGLCARGSSGWMRACSWAGSTPHAWVDELSVACCRMSGAVTGQMWSVVLSRNSDIRCWQHNERNDMSTLLQERERISPNYLHYSPCIEGYAHTCTDLVWTGCF